jgi:hypothetical protein
LRRSHMFALCLSVLVGFADPTAVVQLRYPASRTTVTTASGYMVYYTLALDAPVELRRAYKVLEFAEREVLIAEALQLLRYEMVANERLLEGLRTARLASYLNQTASPPLLHVDPALTLLVPESSLKSELGRLMAHDATIERAIAAVDRLSDAHYQLRQTLVLLAYPDAATRPAVRQPGKVETTRASTAAVAGAPSAPPAPAPNSAIAAATRAEKAAADAELLAEERERNTRALERAAEARYRAATADDRTEARREWMFARDEWEKARREWDSVREKWQTARDTLEAVRNNPRVASGSKPGVPTNTVARPR